MEIRRPGPDSSSLDLIYGDTYGGLVFMERSKALENIAFKEARTWGEFRKALPEAYADFILNEDLHGEEPPDDKPLDLTGVCSGGHYPHFPEQLMLDFIPDALQERFGNLEESALDGEMLFLDRGAESEIVAALRDHGFSVERDDELIEQVYA